MSDHRSPALAVPRLGAPRWNMSLMPWGPRPSVPPPPEKPAGEDRRSPATLAGSGATLRDGGAAIRHLAGLGAGDLRRCIRREPLIGGTPAGTLPTPTLPTPRRRELIDEIELEPTDPAIYDRFCNDTEEDSHGTT